MGRRARPNTRKACNGIAKSLAVDQTLAYVLRTIRLRDTFLHIGSTKLRILSGEDDELVNEGMYVMSQSFVSTLTFR